MTIPQRRPHGELLFPVRSGESDYATGALTPSSSGQSRVVVGAPGNAIDTVLEEMRRLAISQMNQSRAPRAKERIDVETLVALGIDTNEMQLRGLLASIAAPPHQRRIYERPETARPTRATLDKLIAALDAFQREIDETALFNRQGKPWPGHIDLPGAVNLTRAYAVGEREQQSARITRGNQPKPAFDIAVWQLARCWELLTGSFPRASRLGKSAAADRERTPNDDDADTGRFSEWARTAITALAPDLSHDQMAAKTAIAQALRRIAKERRASQERAKDPTRGLRQIVA